MRRMGELIAYDADCKPVRIWVDTCAVFDHVWKQDDPGAPVECVVCGERYPVERKSKEVLHAEIWGRLRDYLQSSEYGYA